MTSGVLRVLRSLLTSCLQIRAELIILCDRQRLASLRHCYVDDQTVAARRRFIGRPPEPERSPDQANQVILKKARCRFEQMARKSISINRKEWRPQLNRTLH